MSVTAQTPYRKFTAAPGATLFSTGFRLILASDLVVKVNGSVVTTGFTVSSLGAGAGSDVTFGTPMTGGEIVELVRSVPKTRLTDYQQLGDYQASSVNNDFDRLVMMLQDSQFFNDLAILLPVGDTAAPMTIPAVVDRALKFLAFDASGNAIAAAGVTDSPVSTFMAAVLLAVDQAAARTAIGAQAVIGYTPANDTAVVKLTGNQTIAGTKTFSSQPALPRAPVLSAFLNATGTAVSVTSGIPTWINELCINFVGISTNGTSNLIFQLRSGTFVVSGYKSSNSSGSGGVASNSITTAHFLAGAVAAGATFRGHLTLRRHPGNVWVGTSMLSSETSAGFYIGTSDVTLVGDLDGFRLTTANGTDTFDAGEVSYLYRE